MVQGLLVVFGLCNFCTSFTTSVQTASVFGAVAGLTVPISFGYLRAMASNSVGPAMQGEALAAIAYIESLDSLLAPIIFNSLFTIHPPFGPPGALPFWAISILAVASSVVLFRMKPQQRVGSRLDSGESSDDGGGDDDTLRRPLLVPGHYPDEVASR